MPLENPEIQTPSISIGKKIKHYTKFFILIAIGVVATFVVPGYYISKTYEKTPARSSDNVTHTSADKLPWYLPHAKKLPCVSITKPMNVTKHNYSYLWPQESHTDRIKNQLTCVPPTLKNKTKVIVVVNKLLREQRELGAARFSECPVKQCKISDNIAELEKADALLFTDDQTVLPNIRRSPDQIWILSIMKSPFYTSKLNKLSGLVNWTATYRSDSDVVTPFGVWMYYNDSIQELPKTNTNFAAKKTKKAAWFVRNCQRDHNRRKRYVEELQMYIEVDVFGYCRELSCPCKTREECFKLLSKYKFYLSFENVNCEDYITEKFFLMLEHNILPVVMGARPQEYARVSPKNSYIHVDEFSSPKELAKYLHRLDQDDELYNSYFRWKGTGEVVDSKFFCRLCALLHVDYPYKSYGDMQLWWNNGSCIQESWSWKSSKP